VLSVERLLRRVLSIGRAELKQDNKDEGTRTRVVRQLERGRGQLAMLSQYIHTVAGVPSDAYFRNKDIGRE
jgi:hypothetical protein